MRWLTALAGWIVIAGVAQAQNDAKKLFNEMEQKLLNAKAYKVTFEVDSIGDKRPLKYKGTIIAATGNRIHMMLEEKADKDSQKLLVISDGKTLARRFDGDEKLKARNRIAHDKLYERLTGWLARAGMLMAVGRLNDEEPLDPIHAKLSSLRILNKEKLGDRETVVMQYRLPLLDGSVGICRLWLDTQNSLPLKRFIEADKAHIIETYSNWELDPKLPDDVFKLPK